MPETFDTSTYNDFLKAKAVIAPARGLPCDPADIHPRLFPHQRDIATWAVQKGRAAIFAAFGMGKTLIQCEIQRQLSRQVGGRHLIVCPLGVRQEFRRDAQLLGMEYKFVRRTEEVCGDGFYLTNYESVRDGKLDPGLFTSVSLDEASCFPAGTLVDTPEGRIPIEEIRIGGIIMNTTGCDVVRAVHRRKVTSVVKIQVNGETIHASEDHKFFTQRGWLPASELRPGDSLVETREAVRILRGDHSSEKSTRGAQEVLQRILQREMAKDPTGHRGKTGQEGPPTAHSKLRMVQDGIRSRSRGDIQEILLPEVFFHMANDAARDPRKGSQRGSFRQIRRRNKGMVQIGQPFGCRSEAENCGTQSDVQPGICCQNDGGAQGEALPQSGRQREIDGSSNRIGESSWECADGICSRDCSCRAPIRRSPERVQVGHRFTGQEDSNRSRWQDTSAQAGQNPGCEENRSSQCSRVDSVKVLELGDSRLDQFRDADGCLYFYDLSATRHPSYSVNGFLVHNCLRSYGSDTYQEFMTLCAGIPYRFVATATPSPNRYKELLHYAAFLGIMDSGQGLTRFFQRDSTKANNLTLYPHMEEEFWAFLHSWAIFLSSPADLGYEATGYDLPELIVHYHEIPAPKLGGNFERDGQGQLIKDAAMGLNDASREKRESIEARVEKMREIIDRDSRCPTCRESGFGGCCDCDGTGLSGDGEDHYILWHDLEAERHAIQKALPSASSVYGTLDLEEREARIIAFSEGETQFLSTKPEISGSGCNLQRHCHKAIFLGIDYQFNDFIQSIHRIRRFGQTRQCEIHIIYTETEREVLKTLQRKWAEHDALTARMSLLIRQYGLSSTGLEASLGRKVGVNRHVVCGERYEVAHNDCVEETRLMSDASVQMILTSIPFGNHYEYSESFNDFGHNQDNSAFFQQMDFLSPQLLRVLEPGRIFACHVKDRIQFGNVTGMGMPTVEPFHADCIKHYTRHGFAYMGMITVVTDVVRENNQTYRLGYTEMCKDGSKMGIGSPEYVLLFRRLPSDTSKGYADRPVTKSKSEYSLARWQVDASAFWRTDGNRFLTAEELQGLSTGEMVKAFTRKTLETIYNYEAHVKVGDDLGDALPRTFSAIQIGSHDPDVWHDVNRMLTLNSEQTRKNLVNHICPLQIEIVERLIRRYTNPGDIVFDPFCGLGTVPATSVKMGRRGKGSELNADYFRDSLRYLEAAETEAKAPTLFDDLFGETEANGVAA